MSQPVALPPGLADRAQDALDALIARADGAPAVAGFAMVLGRMFGALAAVGIPWGEASEMVRIRALTPAGWPCAFRLYVKTRRATEALGELAAEQFFHAHQRTAAETFRILAQGEDPRIGQLAMWAGLLGAFGELSRASGDRKAAFLTLARSLEVRFDADGLPVEFIVLGPVNLPPRRARTKAEARRG